MKIKTNAPTSEGKSLDYAVVKSIHKSNKKQRITQCLYRSVPLSRREISKITGVEICSLCNPLLSMERSGLMKRSVNRYPCQISGNDVFHYSLKREDEA